MLTVSCLYGAIGILGSEVLQHLVALCSFFLFSLSHWLAVSAFRRHSIFSSVERVAVSVRARKIYGSLVAYSCMDTYYSRNRQH